jgi:hypothetical protein
MNEQAAISKKQDRARIYSEEERRLRWAQTIEAILSDPGREVPQERREPIPPPSAQVKQAVSSGSR